MNEVMWREVMDSCNRDAPCRLDLTLATPPAGWGARAPLACGPEIQQVWGWDAEVQWEEPGRPRGMRGALPGSLQNPPLAQQRLLGLPQAWDGASSR